MIRIVLVLVLVLSSTPATAGVKEFAKRWTLRAAGVVAAVALHEACHLAMGKALGARIGSRPNPDSVVLPTLLFGNLNRRQHRAVAASGLMCTGIASELIMWKNTHRRNDFAWGMLADHTYNSGGYAFSKSGDASYWAKMGASPTAWNTVLMIHSIRSGYVLLSKDPLLVRLKDRILRREIPENKAPGV